MSHTLIIVISVLLFAFATAVLYMIGLRKKISEGERLTEMLLNNAALRVVKYLKDQDTITEDGIGYLIKEVKAKEFYSRKTAIITDGKDFQPLLIDYMLRKNLIQKDRVNGKIVYSLAAKESHNEF